MIRGLPIFATLLVAAASATMVALGIWQLERAEWKADLIARSIAAQASDSQVDWPQGADDVEGAIFHRSAFLCERVLGTRSAAGTNAMGGKGWAHYATCALKGGGEAEVGLGWSRQPVEAPEWTGGEVTGFVSPTPKYARLIAAPPQAGLEALARPDPSDLPNNHMAYAVQWFFFAITALVIFLLAVRRKAKDRGEAG